MKKLFTLFSIIFLVAIFLVGSLFISSSFGSTHKSEADEIYAYSSTYVREVASLMKDNWSDDYYSKITMRIGAKLMNIDNIEVETDSAFVEDGELFLPLVDIAQNIGAQVIVNEQTGDTEIVYDKKVSRLQSERFRTSLKEGRHFSKLQAQETLNLEVKKDGDNITITNDFQTRQLIVRMKDNGRLGENFGALQSVSDGNGAYLLQYDTEYLAKQAYNKLSQNINIKWVEPNRIVCLPNAEKASEVSTTALTDRWGSVRINADLMKDYLIAKGKTSTNIFVAVVDTGIDQNHTFLTGRVNTSLGYNFIGDNTNAYDDHNHGTHVAGTIVDCTTNNVKLIPVKVLNSGGSGSYLQVSLGVRHAADKGAKIMNMSLGGVGPSQEVKSAVDYAFNKNVTVVVAAGNDAKDTVHYVPAGYDNVITVSAIDESDSLAWFSNFGDSVDIAAPGVRIQSSIPGNAYATYNGTSMATPHIAAGVACLALNNPSLNPAGLKTAIRNTAIDLGSSRAFGAGVLDLRIFLGISEIPATGLQIYKVTGTTREIVSSIELQLLGDTILGPSLAVQATPANATNKTITASSSNPSIAEFVDGRIVAYMSGTITLTFKTHNNISADCLVKISFEDTWLAYRAAGYAGGSGTTGDPYKIATAEQLAKVAYDLNNEGLNYKANSYKLIADIDLAGKNWYPITVPFMLYDRVVFDGDYHVIKNLTMSTTFTETLIGRGMRDFGLFGLAENATIKNLGMENANLNAPPTAPVWNPVTMGIVAGSIERNTIIENCYVTGSVYSNIRGFFGGLVGYSNYGTPVIANCYARVGGNVQGGIVGYVKGDDIKITNSYATGVFSGSLSFYTGTSTNGAGGLIGEGFGGDYMSSSPRIINCFTSTNVSGQGHDIVGAFIGRLRGFNLSKNYYDSGFGLPGIYTTVHSVEAPIPTTASSFKDTSFFTTAGNWNSSYLWDFTDMWAIDPAINDGFPHLRGFYLIHAQIPVISLSNSVEFLIGETVTLSVSASVNDGGMLSYQWYRCYMNGDFYSLISGATDPTYLIQPTSADYGGGTTFWRVVVTNTNNSATGRKIAEVKSDVIFLSGSVPPPPIIVAESQNTTVEIGGASVLSIDITNILGTLSYQWYSSATNSNTGGTVIDGATNSTYSVPTTAIGTVYYYVEVLMQFSEYYNPIKVTSSAIAVTVYTYHTITISVKNNAGGTASPNGPLTVTTGTNTTINFSPDRGYKIDRIMVNGVNRGNANTFVIKNIKADTVIEVYFVEESSWVKDNLAIVIGGSAGIVGLVTLLTIIVVVHKKKKLKSRMGQ